MNSRLLIAFPEAQDEMHTKELRAGGESQQRLYLLNAWRESPFSSDHERAA
jgi:alkylhydroperoxidase family enzyme